MDRRKKMGMIALVLLVVGGLVLSTATILRQTNTESDETEPRETVPKVDFNMTDLAISESEAKELSYNFINDNLVLPNTTANMTSVEDKGDVYKVNTVYRGEESPVYLTKDGETMYMAALNISNESRDLTAEEAEDRVLEYANNNIKISNATVNSSSVQDEGFVYNVTCEFRGHEQSIHISKDGRYLLFVALNTSKDYPTPTG